MWQIVSTIPYQDQTRVCAQMMAGNTSFFSVDFFADGELNIRYEDEHHIAGQSVLVLMLFEYHATRSVHDQLIAWMLIIDQLHRIGAHQVVACMPYLPYSRHDKSEFDARAGFLDTIVRLLHEVGVEHIITCDVHNEEIVDRCVIPMTSVSAASFWAAHIAAQQIDGDVLLLSPDKGGYERVQRIADLLGASHGYVEKKRFAPNQTKVLDVRADVADKQVIIVDDILDTAGTATNCVQVLKEQGARTVCGCFTHGIFSSLARDRVVSSELATIWVSDTIPSASKVNAHNIKHTALLPWFFEQVKGLLA